MRSYNADIHADVLMVLRGNSSVGGLETSVLRLIDGLAEARVTTSVAVVGGYANSAVRALLGERHGLGKHAAMDSLKSIRRAQVVHFHAATMTYWSWPHMLLARLLRKRVLLTIHLPSEPARRPRISGRLAASASSAGRGLFLRCAGIACFAPSNDAAKAVRRRFFSLVQAQSLLNAVPDLSHRAVKLRTECQFRIAFVGRLVEHKRPTVFIDSLRLLQDRGELVEAHVIGDGPLRVDLQSRAASSGELATALPVVFHGHLSDPFDLISHADLLVLTSISEGCPTTVMEAASLSIPSLVREGLEGVQEVLPDAHFSVSAAAGPREFAERISEIQKEPRLRERIGQAARKSYESSFSVQAAVEAHLSAYSLAQR